GGNGGWGGVHQAGQVKRDRLVAVKVLRGGAHLSPAHLARFRTESRAAARLSHPNIVQVHEVGEHDGLPYLALELVEGGDLDGRSAGRPQPLRDAAQTVATLARALPYAHERGVVHRDLKPANVLLTADGTPKIADFGLAKRLEGGEAGGQTQTGVLMGTPSFMAPEQARGELRDAGPPADVYALGAVLYALLTGRPPFLGATLTDTIFLVTYQEPVPPSRLRPDVPRDLE